MTIGCDLCSAKLNCENIMKSNCTIAFLALSCLWARATITLNTDAGDLRTFGGSALMPSSGQIFLVASTTDGLFGGPTAASFVSGDDVILFRGDCGDVGYFQAAILFSLSGALDAGDPLQLYWFPTLTSSSLSPGEGTTYGSYRDAVGIDGSIPWAVPSDGATSNLKFLTIGEGGTNPEAAGWANQTVAPVPEASNLITAGLTLGLCALRLFRGHGRS